MPGLPTGTVTFLFTDIQSSTKLWSEYPEAMKAALARHDALLRTTITTHGGHVFKTMGDACYAVFATAPDALAAAQAAQRTLMAEPWAIPGGLVVRMALHTGTAEARDGDYYGQTLNRVARLLSAGYGGQILLSEATRALAEPELPIGVSLRDHGAHRLKDLDRPEHIFQLIAPELPTDFPPLRSLETLPNNLPRQLTSFIGREREMEEVKRLLTTNSLLTLTGAGGCGKTRLALQSAADLVETFPDGVWLVELAALPDPGLVLQAVASTLGVRDSLARSLADNVLDFLRSKALLLLLDNCEHLLSACARLSQTLLQGCPHLRILATSQEELGVAGEALYLVPSLSLPDLARLPSRERLTQYEAVRLFVERAILSQPRFTLTDGNASVVAQICHRLDGIPLAIELAAARVKVLSVEQVAARLDDRFRLLTGGSRTAPPRHQTLRAALDWSYELLSEQERTLLRRLAVFAGGFTLEAVEAVCAGSGLDQPDILDLLTQLVDKSLVVFDAQRDQVRYRLLETVRLYGFDRLRESGEEKVFRQQHRDWYLSLVEKAEPALQGSEQLVWLNQLEVEHDNLRAALEWSKIDEDGALAGLRLAGALWRFWEMRGYWSEGREWLEATLSKSAGLVAPERVKALNGAAYLTFYQGDFVRAQALGEESLALSRQVGDKRPTASCLNILGLQACRLENYGQAAALGGESLALSREVGDKWAVAHALLVLGLVARGQGNHEQATTLLEDALSRFQALGDKRGGAITLNSLGLVLRDRGDYDRATALLEDTLARLRELGDKWGSAFALSNLAIVAWNQRNYARAADLFKESLILRSELREKRGIATCLVGLAGVAAAQAHAERAAVLFGAAEALREAIGVHLPPFIRDEYARHVADAKATLDAATFANAWARGRTMALEPSVAYALQEA